jgi:hypothetical protein
MRGFRIALQAASRSGFVLKGFFVKGWKGVRALALIDIVLVLGVGLAFNG